MSHTGCTRCLVQLQVNGDKALEKQQQHLETRTEICIKDLRAHLQLVAFHMFEATFTMQHS